jgi:hypothetical protein
MTWRDVVGFESLYEVSDRGQVRGLKRGRILTASPVNGYAHVILFKDGAAHNRYIHTLVLEAFVGPRPPGQEARHGNNNRFDNWLTNLCWGTRTENAHDKIAHGSDPALERNGRARLTNIQVLEIYRRAVAGECQKDLATEFGVSWVTISHIKKGQTWAELTGATYEQNRVVVTDDLVKRMQAARRAGAGLPEIQRRFGVSKATAFRHSRI